MISDPRPLVLIAEPIDTECADWLAQRARVVHAPQATAGHEAALPIAEALIVRTSARVTRNVLERAPRLRVVGRAGVGLDHIDLAACAGRGVRVVSTPGANTGAVVELVMAFMLDAVRPRPEADRPLSPGAWQALRDASVGRRQLSETTLGILGLGRIGSALARAAAGLGMTVLYHDLRDIPPDERHGAAPVASDELFERAEVLSVHVDGRGENRGLIGETRLARLRPDALLINTSRGFVVDAGALAAWLRANPEARAAVDVHEPEPFGPDYPLLGIPGARLTAHIGAATRTAHRNMSWVVRAVWEALTAEGGTGPGA